MRKGLGLGLMAAGMLAYAGAAQAIEYSGLAFNAVGQNFFFSSIVDEDNMWGSRIELDDPVLGNIGQANYDVSAFANGGTITFSLGSVMNFGSTTMQITGGVLNIGTLQSPATPAVNLPFGFGTAVPDFELEGYLDVLLNDVAVRLHVCETTGGSDDCTDSGNDRPWGNNQPYNTLSVGNSVGNPDDVAMFLYMRGECLGEYAANCPFYSTYTTEEWTGDYLEVGYYCPGSDNNCRSSTDSDWVRVELGSCNSSTKIDGRQVYEEKFNLKDATTSQKNNKKGCEDKVKEYETVTHKDKDVYVKLALWGDTPTDEVPEPAMLSLFSLGLIGLGAAARRRRRAA